MSVLLGAWSYIKDFVGKNKWLSYLGIILAIVVSLGSTITTWVALRSPVVEYKVIEKVGYKEAKNIKASGKAVTKPDGTKEDTWEYEDLTPVNVLQDDTRTGSSTPAAIPLAANKSSWLSLGPVLGYSLDETYYGGAQLWIGPCTISALTDKKLDGLFFASCRVLNW